MQRSPSETSEYCKKINKEADCPCEHCGATLGVTWTDSCTAYPWDGTGQDPNAPVALCPDCRVYHFEYWEEMWSNVYR